MATAEIQSPAPSATALLIIDMINDLDFRAGETMRPAALDAARAIQSLCGEARQANVPIVYVNDNYGQWHSERSLIVEHCRRSGSAGREIVDMLEPAEDDFFVIKPQFSGFYSTYLPALLPRLGASRLILTGIAADICVLFTAGDAHMREYELWVPADCVASVAPERTDWALDIMAKSMAAEIRPTGDYSLKEWLAKGR
jgi:nicotinamidase-related amidase